MMITALDVCSLQQPRLTVSFADEFGWISDAAPAVPNSYRTDIERAQGAGFLDCVQFSSDMYLTMSECNFRMDQGVLHVGEGLLKVHIQLEGDLILQLPSGHRAIMCAGNWGMLVHPYGVEKGEWLLRSQRYAFVTVYCRPQAIAEMLGRKLDIDEVDSFARDANPQCTFVSLPPDPAVALAAREMLHCQYQEPLRLRFLEAKAIELVCRAFGAMGGYSEPKQLGASHDKRLNESRAILLERWTDPPTISELASHVGLNRRALISGFKTAFGSTIFDFIIQQRMNHARILLRDTSLTIAEVAHRVGYSQPNSFSAAFRREFDCAPRDMRS